MRLILSPAVSECRSVKRCRGGVRAVSGGVGAVLIDTGVGVSGWCRTWCRTVSSHLDTAHVYAVSSVSE